MHRTIFVRQLRYWTFHCSLNALPSFGIALFFLGLWRNPVAVAAMLLAIGTFILLYSTLTSLPGPMREKEHLLSRALKVGVKVRGWISAVSVCVIPLGGMMMTPDFWCGFYASEIVDAGARRLGMRGLDFSLPKLTSFSEVFAVTLLEGFMLSFLILIIAFIAVLVLQLLGRLNPFAAADPR
jgi:hypothetical protein